MRLLSIAALTAILATPVAAQNFSGAYGGVQAGYLWGSTSGGANISGDDFVGGVHLGYDFDLGGYVVGGEIDYDAADVNLGGGAATIDGVARLKLRVGVPSGNLLYYGTVGPARVQTSLGDETGYFAGVGLGYAVTETMTLGGELLYHEFDNIAGSGVNAEATTLSVRASFRF